MLLLCIFCILAVLYVLSLPFLTVFLLTKVSLDLRSYVLIAFGISEVFAFIVTVTLWLQVKSAFNILY